MLAYLGDPGLKTRFMKELAKHRKADAIEMKRLIEHYQSDHLSRAR